MDAFVAKYGEQVLANLMHKSERAHHRAKLPNNQPFTEAVTERMRETARQVEQVFDDVRDNGPTRPYQIRDRLGMSGDKVCYYLQKLKASERVVWSEGRYTASEAA